MSNTDGKPLPFFAHLPVQYGTSTQHPFPVPFFPSFFHPLPCSTRYLQPHCISLYLHFLRFFPACTLLNHPSPVSYSLAPQANAVNLAYTVHCTYFNPLIPYPYSGNKACVPCPIPGHHLFVCRYVSSISLTSKKTLTGMVGGQGSSPWPVFGFLA